MLTRFAKVLVDIGKRTVEDDCPGLAAEMSYHLMLALAPTLIFVVSVLGLIGQQQDFLVDFLEFTRNLLPTQVYDLVKTMMVRIISDSSEELAIVSLLAALWIGSNGASVALKALYRAFGFEKEFGRLPYIKQRLLSIGIIISIGTAVFAGSNIMVLSHLMTDSLVNQLGVDSSSLALGKLVNGVVFGGLITGFCLLFYRTVPGKDRYRLPWSCAWPGAVVFTTLWVFLSWVFTTYVESLGRYGEIYGALTAVTLMLVWLYMTSFAFLVGGEVNARCHDQLSEQLKINFGSSD